MHGASTTSLGKPVPLFDHPHIFPNVKSEPLLEQLYIIPMCPITGSQGEETSTSIFISPSQEAVESKVVVRYCMKKHQKTIWTVKWQSMIEKIQCRLLLVSHWKVLQAEIYSLTSVHFSASIILGTA